MIPAIIAILKADPEMQTLLGDRIFNAHDVDEISRTGVPEAFDENNELLPSLLIRSTASTRLPMFWDGQSELLQLYFFQKATYHVNMAAKLRTKQLIHNTIINPLGTEGYTWRVYWEDDLRTVEDEALRASLSVSNYRCLWRETHTKYVPDRMF